MPESHRPKISVIIPLKRLNAYVRESLESLRRQTYTNFDVYVVTDGAEPADRQRPYEAGDAPARVTHVGQFIPPRPA